MSVNLKLEGKDTNGKPVVSGVFWFKDTLGLPFDIIILELVKGDILIDWEDFIQCSILQNYPIDKLIAEILSAFRQGELKGKEYCGVTIDGNYIDYLESMLKNLFIKLWRSDEINTKK